MRLTVPFLAISFAFSGPALAQQSGMYLGGSIGQSKVDLDTREAASDLSRLGITHSGFSEDEKDTAWKAYVGYRFNRSFAIEGGYVDLGSFSASTTVTAVNGVPVPPSTVNATIKTKNGVFVSGLAGLPVGNLSLFGKLGFYSANAKLTVSGGGASSTNGKTDQDILFGLGAEYSFAGNFGIRAEWERFKKVGSENETGEGDVDLMSVGIVYRF